MQASARDSLAALALGLGLAGVWLPPSLAQRAPADPTGVRLVKTIKAARRRETPPARRRRTCACGAAGAGAASRSPRASFRNYNSPDSRCLNLGFRVVREVDR